MDYRMLGDILPAVEIRLQAGEAMYTQSGGMAWMSDGFTLDSNVKGGLMKGLGRMFSGESLFMATYTASRPDSTIAFASTVPGKILAIDTAKTSLICQKGAFLCAQTTVEINTVLTKKFTAGFLAERALSFSRYREAAWPFWRWMEMWWRGFWPPEK